MRRLLSILGPGLLYAGAAIGVSHLVQSTRAGAEFGTQLIWVIVLANLIKYPFFQIGPRYAAITGNNLLVGYHRISPWALITAIGLSLGTMFTVQAAVTIVTAGLAIQTFGLDIDAKIMTGIILAFSGVVLVLGRYTVLDRLMKVVVVVLSVTTITALLLSFGATPGPEAPIFDWSSDAHLLFLVALVGWMPAPLDIAIWHSIWTEEKNCELEKQVSVKEALWDFNVGFVGTLCLAVIFVLLGNSVLYGHGVAIESKAGAFAGQLINMYTQNLGDWAFPIIAVAALTTMFSTTITCLDAYPRTLRSSWCLLMDRPDLAHAKWLYNAILVIAISGAMILLWFFIANMKQMITLATTLAFVISPLFAWLNFMVMNGPDIPPEHQMTPLFRTFCWFGIAAFTLFSGLFLSIQFS